jgi:hypothetical protein
LNIFLIFGKCQYQPICGKISFMFTIFKHFQAKILKNSLHKHFMKRCENIKSIIAMTTFFKFSQFHHGNFSSPTKSMNIFLSFCLRCLFSSNPRRRHILSFNLALFILFWVFFSFNVEREMDKNHARHYPTQKLLRLLCFMGNAITFIPFVVKIYFFFTLSLTFCNSNLTP